MLIFKIFSRTHENADYLCRFMFSVQYTLVIGIDMATQERRPPVFYHLAPQSKLRTFTFDDPATCYPIPRILFPGILNSLRAIRKRRLLNSTRTGALLMGLATYCLSCSDQGRSELDRLIFEKVQVFDLDKIAHIGAVFKVGRSTPCNNAAVPSGPCLRRKVCLSKVRLGDKNRVTCATAMVREGD
jgi:hypothetical protein